MSMQERANAMALEKRVAALEADVEALKLALAERVQLQVSRPGGQLKALSRG